MEIADKYGKYVTFQDDTVLASGLQKVKRGLNAGKEFGVGDLVLKYPKTPGNLIIRGLDYSPAGFIRSDYIAAKPLLKKEGDTRAATLALSRAITGTTGMTGLGYFLADQGIITGKGSDDKDLAALERQTGQGAYRVNLTALTRWVQAGFDPAAAKSRKNDYYASYDWAQPIAMSITLGANAQKAVQNEGVQSLKKGGTVGGLAQGVVTSLGEGIQTVADQPVLKGVTDFAGNVSGNGYGGGSIMEALGKTVQAAPASFVPTALNQIRNVTDPYSRDTSSGSALQQSLAKVQNRIPGLSTSLTHQADTFGKLKPSAAGEGSTLERAFNSFLNPANASRLKQDPEIKLILDMNKRSGETKQVPRVQARTITITVDGQSRTLTAQEYLRMQAFVGQRTKLAFEELNNNGEFKEQSDSDKALTMQQVMTKIGAEAEDKVLGIEKKKTTKSQRAESKARSRMVKDAVN